MRRMSQYERRRPGNAGRGGARHRPGGGNTSFQAKGLSVGGECLGWASTGRCPGYSVLSHPGCRAGGITVHPRGVCERALNPREAREGPSGTAAAANRTRESRPSGMRGGPGETWAMVELGTRGATERAPVGHSPPTVARAPVLPGGSSPPGPTMSSRCSSGRYPQRKNGDRSSRSGRVSKK